MAPLDFYHEDTLLAGVEQRGEKSKRVRQEPLWYDYQRQAWIKDGIVAKCGHRPHSLHLCHACDHAGENAERRGA